MCGCYNLVMEHERFEGGGESGMDAGWGSVAELADKMGKIGGSRTNKLENDSGEFGDVQKDAERKKLYDKLEWIVMAEDGKIEVDDEVLEKIDDAFLNDIREGGWWNDDEFIANIQPAVLKVIKVTNLDKILKLENVMEN